MGLEPTTSWVETRNSTIELLLQTNKMELDVFEASTHPPNSRPLYQLSYNSAVEPEGIEPSTLGSSGQRSTN